MMGGAVVKQMARRGELNGEERIDTSETLYEYVKRKLGGERPRNPRNDDAGTETRRLVFKDKRGKHAVDGREFHFVKIIGDIPRPVDPV